MPKKQRHRTEFRFTLGGPPCLHPKRVWEKKQFTGGWNPTPMMSYGWSCLDCGSALLSNHERPAGWPAAMDRP